MLRKFYHNVINLGVRESDDAAVRNRLRVFNVAMSIILVISVFYLALALNFYYHISTIVCAYSVLSCLIVLFAVHKRRFSFAFHFGMWYGLIFLTAFAFIFGPITNSHYYFIFLPIACLILFDSARVIAAYFILSVIVMLISVIGMDYFEPVYKAEAQEKFLGYPNVPFVMTLVYLAVRMFKNENRNYATQIEEQKSVLEEKNKEVTDSINYARRIQSALLAPAALMKKHLPEHFILYKPKDIVSGDFYFASESKDSGSFWLCVGDCTGHGVPGAFMSLLNISILRELITEQNIDRPDLLLNRQREQIISALNPDGAEETAKDGMDCVLAKFDFSKNVIEFACANNPVWIWREGKLYEFKADKQPVGIHEGETKPFTLHTWNSKPGDMVYLFTDGFADQFGGPRGKKFKYAQLKEQISNMRNQSPEKRGQLLDKMFTDWKGNLEQVDDVLIVGIQL